MMVTVGRVKSDIPVFLQTFFLPQDPLPLASTMLHTSTLTSFLVLHIRLYPPFVSFTFLRWWLLYAETWDHLQHTQLKSESINYTSTMTIYIFKPMYLYFINVMIIFFFSDFDY